MGKRVQQQNQAANAYLQRTEDLTKRIEKCASVVELDSILSFYKKMQKKNFFLVPKVVGIGQQENINKAKTKLNAAINAKQKEFTISKDMDNVGEITEGQEPKVTSESTEVKTTPASTEGEVTSESTEVKTTPASTEGEVTSESAEVKTTPASTEGEVTSESAEVKTTPASTEGEVTSESTEVKTTPASTEGKDPKDISVGINGAAENFAGETPELNLAEENRRRRQLVPIFERLKAIDELHNDLLKRSDDSTSKKDKENYKNASKAALQIHSDVFALSQKYIADGDLEHYKNKSAHIFNEGKDIQELNKHRGINKTILINIALFIAGLGVFYAAACLAKGGFFSVDTKSKKVVDEVSATVTAAIAAPAA